MKVFRFVFWFLFVALFGLSQPKLALAGMFNFTKVGDFGVGTAHRLGTDAFIQHLSILVLPTRNPEEAIFKQT